MKLSLCCLVTFAACHPNYDKAAERMRDPKPVRHDKTIDEPPVAKVPYVEECQVDFRRDPAGVRRDSPAASAHVSDGDGKLARAQQQPKDKATDKVDLVVQSIQSYHRALAVDPYDAEATLQLARAYDQVLRKGCALAMLRRLDELAQHPKLGIAAKPRVKKVADNRDWFHDYRKEALDALGNPVP